MAKRLVSGARRGGVGESPSRESLCSALPRERNVTVEKNNKSPVGASFRIGHKNVATVLVSYIRSVTLASVGATSGAVCGAFTARRRRVPPRSRPPARRSRRCSPASSRKTTAGRHRTQLAWHPPRRSACCPPPCRSPLKSARLESTGLKGRDARFHMF